MTTMNKNTLIITWLGLLFAAPLLRAQPGAMAEDKIKQLRIAFITENLELTSAEAEKFWPVYNAFSRAQKRTRDEIREIQRVDAEGSASDAEIRTHINRIYALRVQEAESEKNMSQEVLPIIGARRTGVLMGLEEKFRQKLIQRFRERRAEGTGGRRFGN